jgi:hypothetical protein
MQTPGYSYSASLSFAIAKFLSGSFHIDEVGDSFSTPTNSVFPVLLRKITVKVIRGYRTALVFRTVEERRVIFIDVFFDHPPG